MSVSVEETDLVRLLARTVKGPVLDPGGDGFAGETAAFNLAAHNQPAIAVGVTEAADVSAAVRAAAERGLAVSVQSTGHGATAGVREGVMVCTRRLNGLQLDPERRTARVEAGVVWKQVIEAAAPHGLAPLNGSQSGVGVTGFVTGGGLPLIGRPYGFAADHVRSLEMVTADGAIRHVDAGSDPDLFWAVRGGGGGFGIVTSMVIDLVPVRTVYGGSIYFPGEAADRVLHAFREWTAAAPDEMTTAITVLRLPDLPDIPPPLAGRLSVSLRVAYTGGAAAGERLLAPMRAVAPALIDAVAEMPYSQCDTIYQDPVDPIPVWARGGLLRELPAGAVDRFLELAGPGVESPLMFIEMRHLGGALGRVPAPANAVGARGGAYTLMVGGVLAPEIAAAVPPAGNALIEAVAPWSMRGSVLTLLGDVGSAEQLEAAWPADLYARLRAIKREVDPQNVFRIGNVVRG